MSEVSDGKRRKLMKKTLVFILAVVMLLSVIPAASYAEDLTADGPFLTAYDAANSEKIVKDNKDKDGKIVPLAGYRYDEKGFHVISPVYQSQPFTQSVAWQALNLTQNNDAEGKHVLSVTFTVDNFGYKGESKDKDEWFCVSVADKQVVTPGGSQYQDGIFILLRGNGDGSVRAETHYDCGSAFEQKLPKSGIAVPLDENGKEVYTFVVDFADGRYKLMINDVDVTPDADIKTNGKNLDELFASFADKAYFQITAQTGYLSKTDENKNKIEYTVNKYNGLVPMGNDGKEPVSNTTKKADIADPSTVAANKPALIWDKTKSSFSDFEGSYIYKENADGTIHVNTNNAYFMWTVKDELSYSASDFPFVCILARSATSEPISSLVYTTYFCADDVLTPDDAHTDSSTYDIDLGNGWVFTVLDGVAYRWSGRINALRIHFKPTEFDLAWVGCFRNADEGQAYAIEYLKEKGIEVTTQPVTTRAARSTKEVTTAAPAPGTTAPGTTAPETTAEQKSGCGSTVAIVAVLPALTAAYVLKKKKD